MPIYKKILLNLSTTYLKIIINAIVAVFTTKIALETLGEVDYGLFVLIGGVIMLLSFLNGALLLSTQRFLSISIGEKDWNGLKVVFNCSFMLHIVMALIILIFFKALQPFLFHNFLNIPNTRLDVAILTYNIVIITSCLTFITVPYNAIINAREDIWFLAITDVVVSLLKLGAAFAITFSKNRDNLLVEYSFLIMLSVIVNFILQFLWSKKYYSETKLQYKLLFNKEQIRNQLSFTGWNTLVSFAVVCRNQGVAVVLNVFYGAAINSAYGIANQLNALVLTFSSALTNVFAPQIIQSKGAGNDERMFSIANFSTKLSFYISSLVGIPIVIECNTILNIWLKNVPEYSAIFCKILVFVFIIMQMYPGLVRCLYAIGKIKWYQITVSLLLILPIPIGYIFNSIFRETPPQIILFLVLIAQVLTLFATVFFTKKILPININNYFKDNILKPCLIFGVTFLLILLCGKLFSNDYVRITITFALTFIVFTPLCYVFLLSNEEKAYFKNLINKLALKFN